MTFFSEYIKSIISVGLCAFICESVCSYFSKGSSAAKGLKFMTNLCVFTVAIFPIFSLFSKADFDKFDLSFNETYSYSENSFIDLTEKETEKELLTKIFKDTGIKAQSISIDIECSEEKVDIKNIEITVQNESEIPKVREYLDNIFSQETKTKITVNKHEQSN